MAKELILFQENQVMSRAAAAKRLRELAGQIYTGQFTLGAHQVVLPEEIDIEIEFDGEDDEGELEIELMWAPSDAMPLSGIAES